MKKFTIAAVAMKIAIERWSSKNGWRTVSRLLCSWQGRHIAFGDEYGSEDVLSLDYLGREVAMIRHLLQYMGYESHVPYSDMAALRAAVSRLFTDEKFACEVYRGAIEQQAPLYIADENNYLRYKMFHGLGAFRGGLSEAAILGKLASLPFSHLACSDVPVGDFGVVIEGLMTNIYTGDVWSEVSRGGIRTLNEYPYLTIRDMDFQLKDISKLNSRETLPAMFNEDTASLYQEADTYSNIRSHDCIKDFFKEVKAKEEGDGHFEIFAIPETVSQLWVYKHARRKTYQMVDKLQRLYKDIDVMIVDDNTNIHHLNPDWEGDYKYSEWDNELPFRG